MKSSLFTLCFTLLLLSCSQQASQSVEKTSTDKMMTNKPGLQIAHLADGDEQGLQAIRASFKERNPGYDMSYLRGIDYLNAKDYPRMLFIQEADTPRIKLADLSSETTIGDIIIVDANEELTADKKFSALMFDLPDAPADSIPRIIRPDWDPNITDIPGGCATETNAYRRILLTWKNNVGHYLYHSLNAHRVRIMDSFTHYHPVEGGFDEFYLVQMTMPMAQVLTSTKLDRIVNPETIEADEAQELITYTDLKPGDLLYMPKGTIHRGIGGVLAQVITVPGFIPGTEIGVDHHLKAINDRLGLEGEKKLPFHKLAADSPVIR